MSAPPAHDELLANLKRDLPDLEKLLLDVSGEWTYEDAVYRFYHHSFKVYHIQHDTLKIVEALKKLNPGEPLNKMFEKIVSLGTGKVFLPEHNNSWMRHTPPMLNAFFHAKYFLEMAVKYANELKKAPMMLPTGWAAFLYLFDKR